jgi:hypothetical protein
VLSEAAASILSLLPLAAAAEPAGGAEAAQVAIATAGAALGSTLLLGLAMGHRSGRVKVLGRAAAVAERVSGLPGWAALPTGIAAVALNVALLGMYWDISLHIDNGRDAGPLANPAHYLILAGLFGIFAAGVLAIVLPEGRPGPRPVRIARGWYAPVGGILIAACGAFSLIAFPLDDFWHRIFGQDVTLWGPTHLMLIGGAGLSLVGQAVLLGEGMHARAGRPRTTATAAPRTIRPEHVTAMRRVGLMGGLLIGLSTFQAEFDFGVPQYRLLFQPMLIALAAGAALVAARLWIGRGGAIGAALFFLALRGFVALLVGPVFGQTTPALPLYLGEALCVEALALVLARRPLALGIAGGAAIGTVGLATEWGWSQFAMRLPWSGDLLPEAILFAVGAGVAGGVAGAMLALGLRSELPRPAVARPAIVLATAVVGVLVAAGLHTEEPRGARATVALTDVSGGAGRSADAVVRVEPRSLTRDHAAWVTVTAWQGGGLHVDRLRQVAPGVFRTTKPIPLHGSWKSLVRIHAGNAVLGAPVYMPADPAIPAPEIPAAAQFTRKLQRDTEILQRERDFDVPAWLWGGAATLVVALYLALLAALSWGVGRIGRTPRATPPADFQGTTLPQPLVPSATPVGAG